METYNNLKELLEAKGDGTPYNFGRSLYKYTDCGPWTAFIVSETEASREEYRVEVREKDGGLMVVGQRFGQGDRCEVPADVASFLGFDEEYLTKENKRDCEGFRNLDEYFALIEAYMKRSGKGSFEITEITKCLGCLRITLGNNIEGTSKDVYYEDDSAHQGWEAWAGRCTGIEIGSIVEGSDVYVGPEQLMFPFTDQDLDKVVSGIDKEASFYWERDNSHWFCLCHAASPYANFKETWGEITWDCDEGCDVPEEIKAAAEHAAQEGEGFTWNKGEGRLDLGDGWVLVEYVNDYCY